MSCEMCHGLFGRCEAYSWYCKRCYAILNSLGTVGDEYRMHNEAFIKSFGKGMRRKDWPKLMLMDEIVRLREEVKTLKGFDKPVNEWAEKPWLKCDEAK